MKPSKETLSAFVDGALPPAEMERVARLLAEDPELDAWVRHQEALRTAIHDRFAAMLEEETPSSLLAALDHAPVSWRWRLRPWLRWGVPGAALAAGLAALLLWQAPQRPDATLALALNQQLASAPPATSAVRIGLTFRNKEGVLCRSYSEAATAGYACRDDGNWRIALETAAPTLSSAAYQMAGSAMPDALRSAIQSAIQGAPLDAAQERAARAKNWQ